MAVSRDVTSTVCDVAGLAAISAAGFVIALWLGCSWLAGLA
jgi:hypothetical protein